MNALRRIGNPAFSYQKFYRHHITTCLMSQPQTQFLCFQRTSSSTRSFSTSVASKFTLSSIWPRFPEKWFSLPSTATTTAPDALSSVVTKPVLDPPVDGMWPHHIMSQLLDFIHFQTGLSWVAVGWLAAVTFRLAVIIPITLRSMEQQTLSRLLSTTATELVNKLKKERLDNNVEGIRQAKLNIDKFSDENFGVLSIRSQIIPFVPFILSVIFAASSILAWRYMCFYFPSMTIDNNIFSISSLHARTIDVDPWLKFPLIASFCQFASISLHAVSAAKQPKSKFSTAILVFSYVWTIFFSIIAPFFPQGVILCYWLPAALLTLVQSLTFTTLFRVFSLNPPMPRVRKLLSETPSLSPHLALKLGLISKPRLSPKEPRLNRKERRKSKK